MTKIQLKKTTAAFLFAFSCLIPSLRAQVISVTDSTQFQQNISSANDSLNAVDNEFAESEIQDSLEQPPFMQATQPEHDWWDTIYEARLSALCFNVPMDYNPEVRKYIDMYVNRTEQVSRMAGESKFYFPIFETILAQNNVPTELKYLPIIESALNPNAVSRCGATGLWQFMYTTAKLYGLQVNSYVDERRDIFHSTQAACDYLNASYAKYGDWLLAIASYNCGPGNVDRALGINGGGTFWDIAKYLPKETRSYVPLFIAAAYIMNYYPEHGMYAQTPMFCCDNVETIVVNDKMSLDQIAKYTSMTLDEVKYLNPGLKSNVIPVLSEPYELKIPCDNLQAFDANKDSIVLMSINSKIKTYYSGTGDAKIHIVKSGETLGGIATKNHVTVSQIKAWNGIKGTTIWPGQKLKLYGTYSTGNSTSTKTTSTTTTTTKNGTVYYKVKSGDSLWSISKKYPGVTVDELKASNDPSKYNNLQPGMILKINL